MSNDQEVISIRIPIRNPALASSLPSKQILKTIPSVSSLQNEPILKCSNLAQFNRESQKKKLTVHQHLLT